MGWASEEMIAEHNRLMESDDEYAENYARKMDAALEADFFASEIENEKLEDWFPDLAIDHAGRDIELPPELVYEIDEDIPF